MKSTDESSFAAQTTFQPLIKPPSDVGLSAKSQRILYTVLLLLSSVSMVLLVISTAMPEICSDTAWSQSLGHSTNHLGYFRKCVVYDSGYTGYGSGCGKSDSNYTHVSVPQAFAVISDFFAGLVMLLLVFLPLVRALQARATRILWMVFGMALIGIACTTIALAVFIPESTHGKTKLEYGFKLALVGGACQLIIAVITGRLASKKVTLSLEDAATLPF